MKRDKFDKLFSDSVRERDDWTCQRCGKYFPEGHRQGLHCSHIFSRRHRATRWEPKNATSHCFSCHQYLGSNPIMFNHWARDQLGDDVIDYLEKRHREIVKLTTQEKKEMYIFMHKEYDRMKDERMNGEQGVLSFSGFL